MYSSLFGLSLLNLPKFREDFLAVFILIFVVKTVRVCKEKVAMCFEHDFKDLKDEQDYSKHNNPVNLKIL